MLNSDSRRGSPRFHFPTWLAHSILGNRRFITLPICSLVDEVQFRGITRLHNPATKRFICSGDLYAYLDPVANSSTAREVGELIDAKLDYRATAVYRSRIRLAEKGIRQKFHARHLRSPADVDEYFEYQVRLIRSIIAYGCLSRREMSEHHRAGVPEFSTRRPTEHEIGCAIGPEGEAWMFRTGHHQLHIARKLGIEKIPVEVHFVHREWVVRCWRDFRHAPLPISIAAAVNHPRKTVTVDD